MASDAIWFMQRTKHLYVSHEPSSQTVYKQVCGGLLW